MIRPLFLHTLGSVRFGVSDGFCSEKMNSFPVTHPKKTKRKAKQLVCLTERQGMRFDDDHGSGSGWCALVSSFLCFSVS